MIILDTDCMSLLQRENILAGSRLQENLGKFSSDEICTTIISFEEQMRGWLSFVAKSKTLEQEIYAYERLHAFLNNYRNALILDFDEKAVAVFREFKSQKIRVGTMDLKIAAIAVSQNAILVSRNLSDFLQIPNLSVEDWTK
ncbi:MAG: type II toxin-antitoxin system VapC family toxin [Pyrinomonadaceae bacterium]|nr:type II toxin-antitoxin system VapC family toxin [Pyrinomonadaceae bacterium]